VNGQRSVTAAMAIRLGQAFGTMPNYWMNPQTIYDLKQARAAMPAGATKIETLAVA
jgi:addiction module HigA family antidote